MTHRADADDLRPQWLRSTLARVGIATGLVVVGDLIGSGEQHERGIVGETPNLAARLQGVAEPDTVTLDCASSLNQPVTNCHGRGFTF